MKLYNNIKNKLFFNIIKNNQFNLIILLLVFLFIFITEYIIYFQIVELMSEINALGLQIENSQEQIKDLFDTLSEKNKLLVEKNKNIESLQFKLKLVNTELNQMNTDYKMIKDNMEEIIKRKTNPPYYAPFTDIALGSVIWVYVIQQLLRKKFLG